MRMASLLLRKARRMASSRLIPVAGRAGGGIATGDVVTGGVAGRASGGTAGCAPAVDVANRTHSNVHAGRRAGLRRGEKNNLLVTS
jgi:hypothetical protein